MTTHKIEVIGPGCKNCKVLFELTREVAKELDIQDEVEYSTDVTRIIQMGVMSSPVLAIDSNPVLAGSLPDKEKLKEILKSSLNDQKKSMEPKSSGTGCCSCGGKC